ncbi:MAG: hypothetical protein KVP17_005158 [Porospora cf. gigantea B]|uniref:uncharacterized protein n=1 Tax=Porospora cf. gigantea B TaxID=2853592 RepID=UPI003571B048|nr:MAG: hypothetical protein KVP17_005158 [Porospora cf. gigantea B]
MHPFSGVPYPTPSCILSPQHSDDKLSDTCCGHYDSNSEPGEDDAFDDDLENYTRTATRGSLLSSGDDDMVGRACTPGLRASARLRRRLSLGQRVSLHRIARRRFWVYRALLLLGILALCHGVRHLPTVSFNDATLMIRKHAAKTPFFLQIAMFSFVHYIFVVLGVPTTLWEVTFALCVGNACFVGLIVSKVLALLTAHFIVELPFVKMRVEAKIRQQPVLCAVRDIAEEHPLRSALLIRWCYIPTSVKNYTVRTVSSCYADGAVGRPSFPRSASAVLRVHTANIPVAIFYSLSFDTHQ